MRELITIQPSHYVFPNHPGPIDPILRASYDSKYHLCPVYDFVASIVHSRVGRVWRFPGKGQTRRFVRCRRVTDGAPNPHLFDCPLSMGVLFS